MSLPKLSVPKYNVTLPISKKELTVRPFLVKEEKVLMLAFESKEPGLIVGAIGQIIIDCTTDEDFNVFDLPMVDAEYLIIKLKSFSRGETIDLTMKCNNIIDDYTLDAEQKRVPTGEQRPCGHRTDISVSLEHLDDHIDTSKILDPEIKLSENVGVTLRPPRFNCLRSLLDQKGGESDHIMNVLIDSIESIWTGDEVFPSSSESREALTEFVESMDMSQFKKLKAYFSSLPEIAIKHQFQCPECKHEEMVNVRNLHDFFG